jgi:hypothetical protein
MKTITSQTSYYFWFFLLFNFMLIQHTVLATEPNWRWESRIVNSVYTNVPGFGIHTMIDVPGWIYYVVVPGGDPAPISSEVKAGKRSGGDENAVKSGNVQVTQADFNNKYEYYKYIEYAATPHLDSGTAYDVYLVGENVDLVLMEAPEKLSLTTGNPSAENPNPLTHINAGFEDWLIENDVPLMPYGYQNWQPNAAYSRVEGEDGYGLRVTITNVASDNRQLRLNAAPNVWGLTPTKKYQISVRVKASKAGAFSILHHDNFFQTDPGSSVVSGSTLSSATTTINSTEWTTYTSTITLSSNANRNRIRWNVNKTAIASEGDYIDLDNIRIIDASLPPGFHNSTGPEVFKITTTACDLSVNLDEAGKAYYVVVPFNDSAPSVSEIKQGKRYGGSDAVSSGMITVPAGFDPYVASISGLSSNTEYDIYVICEDNETVPNVQQEVSKIYLNTNLETGVDNNNSLMNISISVNGNIVKTIAGVEENSQLIMYDIFGRCIIISSLYGINANTVEISDIRSGVYLVVLQKGEMRQVFKISI